MRRVGRDGEEGHGDEGGMGVDDKRGDVGKKMEGWGWSRAVASF